MPKFKAVEELYKILQFPDIKLSEKILLWHIQNYSQKKGYFYQSSEEICKSLSMCHDLVTNNLKSLERKGLIRRETKGNRTNGGKVRIIRYTGLTKSDNKGNNDNMGITDNEGNTDKSSNANVSNTDNISISNDDNIQEVTPITSSLDNNDILEDSLIDVLDIYTTVINYLNEKANTQYRASNISTKKHINARIKEGYKLEDFKEVIDKKCSEWLGDPKMENYLRPETLFGTKFESYLNAKQIVKGINGKPISISKENNDMFEGVF